MQQERVVLGAYWRDRRASARELVGQLYRFVEELRAIHPIFARRCVVVGGEPRDVPSDPGEFEELLAQALADDRYRYENPDPDVTSFTLESSLSSGFIVTLSDPDPAATDQTAATVRVTAGARGRLPNSVVVEIPPSAPELRSSSGRGLELFRTVVERWSPFFASLTSTELAAALDSERRHKFRLGVINYLVSAEAASACHGAAESEAGPHGGVLLRFDIPPPWAARAAELRPCMERLAGAGMLGWK